MKRVCLYFFTWICVLVVNAQPRVVQNRPYIDERFLHYGFQFGVQMQDLEMSNNGYVDPETGERWYADVDNYSPGFNVGVLAEMKLHKHFSLRLTPTMYFGQKRVWMHEQVSGRDTTQNIKSTLISFPLHVKMSAPRYNNFRPYFIAGLAPSLDLTNKKHGAFRLDMFDCYVEMGMGCDFYLPFFKLIPELKFSFGLFDILTKNRTDLLDNGLIKMTKSVDKARSKMITLTFYFE
ncbi:MAG: PorT family protein [Bacteroidaceae bacterium]|nr:PorT family protein [Bacteroidaceae bacterium]